MTSIRNSSVSLKLEAIRFLDAYQTEMRWSFVHKSCKSVTASLRATIDHSVDDVDLIHSFKLALHVINCITIHPNSVYAKSIRVFIVMIKDFLKLSVVTQSFPAPNLELKEEKRQQVSKLPNVIWENVALLIEDRDFAELKSVNRHLYSVLSKTPFKKRYHSANLKQARENISSQFFENRLELLRFLESTHYYISRETKLKIVRQVVSEVESVLSKMNILNDRITDSVVSISKKEISIFQLRIHVWWIKLHLSIIFETNAAFLIEMQFRMILPEDAERLSELNAAMKILERIVKRDEPSTSGSQQEIMVTVSAENMQPWSLSFVDKQQLPYALEKWEFVKKPDKGFKIIRANDPIHLNALARMSGENEYKSFLAELSEISQNLPDESRRLVFDENNKAHYSIAFLFASFESIVYLIQKRKPLKNSLDEYKLTESILLEAIYAKRYDVVKVLVEFFNYKILNDILECHFAFNNQRMAIYLLSRQKMQGQTYFGFFSEFFCDYGIYYLLSENISASRFFAACKADLVKRFRNGEDTYNKILKIFMLYVLKFNDIKRLDDILKEQPSFADVVIKKKDVKIVYSTISLQPNRFLLLEVYHLLPESGGNILECYFNLTLLPQLSMVRCLVNRGVPITENTLFLVAELHGKASISDDKSHASELQKIGDYLVERFERLPQGVKLVEDAKPVAQQIIIEPVSVSPQPQITMAESKDVPVAQAELAAPVRVSKWRQRMISLKKMLAACFSSLWKWLTSCCASDQNESNSISQPSAQSASAASVMERNSNLQMEKIGGLNTNHSIPDHPVSSFVSQPEQESFVVKLHFTEDRDSQALRHAIRQHAPAIR